MSTYRVLNVRVDVTSYPDAVERILSWALRKTSGYVCACNVHMIMEAHDDPSFLDVVNGARLVTPDGMPVVWSLRAQGADAAVRVYGPDLMLALCAGAARAGVPIGLYGGTSAVLDTLVPLLSSRFPDLSIASAHAPPFGQIDATEEELDAIHSSGVGILFVALGCPKQERWMARHGDRMEPVMVGVGAAFDFLAGRKRQAPTVLQKAGLEWAFRLACEPRRLFRRYALHNPRFVALAGLQLAADRARRVSRRSGTRTGPLE